MSSHVFEAFDIEAEGEGREALERFHAFLAERSAEDLFDQGAFVEIGGMRADKAARLIEIAIEVGLLQSVQIRRCPNCSDDHEEAALEKRLQDDGEVECQACGSRFPDLDGWSHGRLQLELSEPAATALERKRRERDSKPRRTAVVITALGLERDAVLEHLPAHTVARHDGTIFYEAELEGRVVLWKVAICMSATGNASTAVETTRAISTYRPLVAMFVGIAGGFPNEVDLGEVVAATRVYNWQSGKDAKEGFTARPEEGQAEWALRQEAGEVIRTGEWIGEIKGDRQATSHPARVEPLVAGDALMRTTKSDLYKQIRQNYDRAVGVEMEGHGFHEAAKHAYGVMAIVIRGISDRIVDKKKAERGGWQPRAAAHAAAFAIQLLRQFEPPTGPQAS